MKTHKIKEYILDALMYLISFAIVIMGILVLSDIAAYHML